MTSIFSDKDPSNIKGINIGIGNAYCKSVHQRRIEDFMKNMSKEPDCITALCRGKKGSKVDF